MTTINLNPTADTQVDSSSPGSNYGSTTTLDVAYVSADVIRALLQFDISSIPASQVITSAQLVCTANGAGNAMTVSAHRMTAAWVEGTLTWSTPPNFSGSPFSSVGWGTETGAHPAIDLTAAVQNWYSGAWANYGILLRSPEPGSGVGIETFYSREGATPPVLTITYVPSNVAPNAPNWSTPSGAYDVAAALPLAAPFSDPNVGDSPGAYALKRTIGATTRWWNGSDWSSATEVKNVSTAQSWTIPAGWGIDSDADHAYQVKYWDISDAEGTYSASLFITPSSRVNPTLDTPADAATVSSSSLTAAWTVAQQSAYRLRLLDSAGTTELWSTGWVSSVVARSAPIGSTLANATSYKVELTTKNTEGLASTVVTHAISVSYTAPATPTAVVTGNSPIGAITVGATHPTPSGSQPLVGGFDLFRRVVGDTDSGIRLAANVTPSGSFVDWAVESGTAYEYRVKDLGANGTSSFSAWTT